MKLASVSLSGVRWALAVLLALVGIVSAVTALRTYAAHGLVLGVLAVLTLVAITVAGMASLALARRRIGAELAGLNGDSPAGALYLQRKQRLEALKATGARPDLRALADATAAQEASRAYLGRYLVATTVLVGLVGTFAGLMETLGKVAPLLSDEGGALALLAAPLSGLHVTFGASLVAIVVTLALSLAQGDLVLHEEQALATLEDLTHHRLVPELWPAHGEAHERTVRLLEGLSESLAQAVVSGLERATEALNRTQETRFSNLAAQLASSAHESATAVRSHASETAAALAATSATVEAKLQSLAERLSDKLAESTQQQALQVGQAVAHVSQRLADSGDRLVLGWQQALSETAKAVASSSEEAIAQSALLAEQMNAQLARAVQALQASLEDTARTTMQQTSAAVVGSAGAVAASLEPLFAAESQERLVLTQALEKNLASVGDWLSRVDRQTQTLEAQAQAHAQALAETLSATARQVVQGLGETTLRNGQSLQGAADRMLEGARTLEQTLTPLAPRLEALSVELERLTHEVALMAAQSDAAQGSALVLAELERVGDGLERLASLVRLAREPEAPELQEAHS